MMPIQNQPCMEQELGSMEAMAANCGLDILRGPQLESGQELTERVGYNCINNFSPVNRFF